MLDQKEIIKNVLIEDDMKEAYLRFSMSVIISRALPDARDGLKPSQRRILVAMNELNLGPRSKYVKCAKICGDTQGNYHPHGEQVIYPTLVRMAQEFNMRYPLIDGQGNFGSIDGDPPAQMRYTEARMRQPTVELMQDIQMTTVDFVPNYDERLEEPTVLPARFPNLLCNGSSGIAVGMATSIPPHNLNEICDATIKVIDEPDISVDDLLKIIQGPDFPTGALICGRSGLVQGYKTGRGNVIVRARAHIETSRSRGSNQSIVVTEIPYMVNRERILERIGELVKDGKIEGLVDARNESDANTRLVIDLKREAEPEVVLNLLYKHTALQQTFSIILIALQDGRPKTMSIKELIVAYIEHRKVVIRRRTQYLLDQALAEAHILEGLIIALDNIDEVIEIIRGSRDVPSAKNKLMKRFKLSERQADAILQMRLQRLTGLERKKLEDRLKELKERIDEYRAILADINLVLDIIREDLYELKEKFGDARRTEIVGAVGEFDMEDLIAEENVAVTITHEGYIKRMQLNQYRKQNRGGKGVTGAGMKEEDFLEHLFIASTHDYILFFTDKGRLYWLKVYDIVQQGRQSRGRAIVNVLEMQKGENITSMIPVREFDERQIVMFTESGVIKKTPLNAFSHPKRGGIIAIKLDSGDQLMAVRLTNGDQELFIGTANGQAIRFHEKHVRSMGRNTRGVKAVNLRGKDKVVGAAIVDNEGSILTVCENGFGKRTSFRDYPSQSRGGLGVINIKATERNGPVVAVLDVHDDDDLMMMTANGMVIRCPVSSLRIIGRNTQGVTVIRLDERDQLVAMTKVPHEEEDEEADPQYRPENEEGLDGETKEEHLASVDESLDAIDEKIRATQDAIEQGPESEEEETEESEE